MAKKSASIENMKYEQALAGLEEIISSLENEPSGLEKSVAMFERGKELIQHCQKLLNNAELKVRQLEADGSTSPLEERTT
ncbi:MAG: exodeoxyribonuclease VII small subunit [Deltaproteobacteria bacterium]|nr:exodeoxyribonuclease VII small subunit [Deltaproteobacteria bacterium]